MYFKFSSFLALLLFTFTQMSSCTAQNQKAAQTEPLQSSQIPILQTGAERMNKYLPLLKNRRTALLVNQTSVVKNADGQFVPLADTLISLDVDVRFLMTPEHGLKGTVSAGDAVGDGQYDKRRDIPVRSLYGKNKKPQPEWLDEVDCVVFDVQDVGCRFYTYLSTLYYLLQACGECGKDVIVLDRPNPHDTIDGPVLEPQFRSFVGMVEVPLLHGCTLGELARMIVGEKWIGDKTPTLTVIPVSGWRHGDDYSLPIAPSPNLRTDHAIRLYPSLCLFEATEISVGRGTDWPFEVLGHPTLHGDFSFTPHECEAATRPLQEGKICYGFDLRPTQSEKGFHLRWLLECHRQMTNDAQPTCWITQPTFFDRLAGTNRLREQIGSGLQESEIRATWQNDLEKYRKIRSQYILY